MVLARNEQHLVAIGVEAKVDEEFGPTVGQKRKKASPGQTERLEFLHKELGLEEQLEDRVRYQLLHRTVSAVLTARDFHAQVAVMAVQSFSKTAAWHQDFVDFAAAAGGKEVADDVYHLGAVETPRVYLAWCRAESPDLEKAL